MLCRADSFLDELSPIQTPFLIASLRRSWTRANSPVSLIRSGGEREQGEGGRGPWSLPAGHTAASLCAAVPGVACALHHFTFQLRLTKALWAARAGVRAGARLGSPASSVLPGQEGIHAANVMISAQEGDEGWSVKLSDCCEQAWENRRIQPAPLGLCRAQISPPER